MAIVMLRCTSLTQVQHTKTSTECHQPATVALCLQHLTVVPLTTHESRSNTWKIGNAPVFWKWGPRCYVVGHARWLNMVPLVWYGKVEFNVPLNTLYVILETILRVRWQTTVSQNWWLVNQVKGQSHQAQLTKREGCKQKNYYVYTAPWRPMSQRRWEDRELNQARSKPDTVDWPVKTACTFVNHYNSTEYCNTGTSFFFNIPLPPDQHHISDVAKWR